MAVPKRKVSKARRDKRRSNVWKLKAPGLVECPQCHELKKAHVICDNCGYYNGKEILRDGKIVAKIKDAKSTKKESAVKSAPVKEADKAEA